MFFLFSVCLYLLFLYCVLADSILYLLDADLDTRPSYLPSLPGLTVLLVAMAFIPPLKWIIQVSKPLETPPACLTRSYRTKAPTPALSCLLLPLPLVIEAMPLPGIIISKVVYHMLTISIPPQKDPIPVPRASKKQVCCKQELLPPPKKCYPVNTSTYLTSYEFLISFINIIFIAQNLQELFGLYTGHPYLHLVSALFAFPIYSKMVCLY